MDVKWSILVFITVPAVTGIGDRSLKHFTVFRIGQTPRFKMVSASVQLSVAHLMGCAEALGTTESGSAFWPVAGMVEVQSTSETVLEHKAGFCRLTAGAAEQVLLLICVFLFLW